MTYLLCYSQDFDDSDDLLMQNKEEDMSQNVAENVGNSQNAADDLESSQNSAEDVQNSQNAGEDIDATQCNEGDEILRTQRSQRFESRKKNAQLNRDKVKDAHSKFTEKLKRKAENYPVERPKFKSKRTDSSLVWYFYNVFLKKGE